jgi:hypothetical protein
LITWRRISSRASCSLEKRRTFEDKVEKRDIISDYSDYGSQVYAPKTLMGVFPDTSRKTLALDIKVIGKLDGEDFERAFCNWMPLGADGLCKCFNVTISTELIDLEKTLPSDVTSMSIPTPFKGVQGTGPAARRVSFKGEHCNHKIEIIGCANSYRIAWRPIIGTAFAGATGNHSS